jgi:hypothetical protein
VRDGVTRPLPRRRYRGAPASTPSTRQYRGRRRSNPEAGSTCGSGHRPCRIASTSGGHSLRSRECRAHAARLRSRHGWFVPWVTVYQWPRTNAARLAQPCGFAVRVGLIPMKDKKIGALRGMSTCVDSSAAPSPPRRLLRALRQSTPAGFPASGRDRRSPHSKGAVTRATRRKGHATPLLRVRVCCLLSAEFSEFRCLSTREECVPPSVGGGEQRRIQRRPPLLDSSR